MLIALLVFEIILIGLTIFTTHMVEHKFESIHASLRMYCNKRTYKTKADIDFIETIINDYKRLCSETDEEPDLVSAISLKLHKEYIGRFTYIAIKNIAIKAKQLMWGIFAAEILIAYIDQTVSQSQTIIIVVSSLLLTIMMYFYGVIKGIEEKQEILIDEVTHYIRNVYPIEVMKQKREIERQENKLNKREEDNKIVAIRSLDKEQKGTEKIKENKVSNKSGLSAKDIAQLLKNL